MSPSTTEALVSSRTARAAPAPSASEGGRGRSGLSLEQRTNFDGGRVGGPIRHRAKLLVYPDRSAEMVMTRLRKPADRSRSPAELVDEDGVVTEAPAPPAGPVAPLDPTEIVARRTKSANRARTGLRRAIMAGGLDHMITLTFRQNLTDVDLAWRIAMRWIRAMRDALGGFSYAIVAERQKRGAWHFHCAVKGWQNLKLIRNCWKRAGGDGNIDVEPPRKSSREMAGYMSKYISKSFTDEELSRKSHHRYRRSHDLKPDAFVQCVTCDPAEAHEVMADLFRQAGLVGFAQVTSGDPRAFEYFVWGSTWSSAPPGPARHLVETSSPEHPSPVGP